MLLGTPDRRFARLTVDGASPETSAAVGRGDESTGMAPSQPGFGEGEGPADLRAQKSKDIKYSALRAGRHEPGSRVIEMALGGRTIVRMG
jgi:hypothetical protein